MRWSPASRLSAPPTRRADLFLERGECLLRLGQWSMAADDLTRALEFDARSQQALWGRAAAFRALGRTEEAEGDLREAGQPRATEPEATP